MAILFFGLIVFVIFLIRSAIFNFTREKLLNEKEKAKKEELDLYKIINFYTDFGHYRWPIKVYDSRGNVAVSYIEGQCIPVDEL